MSSPTQQKFDELVKEVYWDTLKPLGFKKKANNFYIFTGEIGKIINIQKSMYGTKDDIRFTINIGIFSPEIWLDLYNYQNKPVPVFPTEPDCIVRKRIGSLLKQGDIWYDHSDTGDLTALRDNQRRQLKEVILPYFATINTNEDLIQMLDKEPSHTYNPIARLILLAALKRTDAAKKVMEELLNGNPSHNQKIMIMEKAKAYGLL
jgi:hypothetical protein